MSAPVSEWSWDYAWDAGGRPWIVVTTDRGAGRLECANVPGAQLQHLECPLDGPCAIPEPYGPDE